MKKSIIIGGILFLAILSISLVAAQALPAPDKFSADMLKLFSNLLVEQTGMQFTDRLYTRVILMLLITAALYKGAHQLVKNSGMAFIVSLLVAILGVRFFTPDMIDTILLPYGVVGLALTTTIPILLYGLLIETSDLPRWIRKAGWFLLALAFVFTWIMRYGELSTYAYLYLLAALLCMGVFIFERQVYNMWLSGQLEGVADMSKISAINVESEKLNQKYIELGYAKDETTRTNAEKEIDQLKLNIARLLKK